MSVCVKIRLAASVLVLLSMRAVALAHQGTEPPNLAVVKQFVLAAFPELAGQSHKIAVSLEGDFDKNWTELFLGSFSIHAHEPRSATHQTRVLNGRFQLVGARVREAHFEGDFVNSANAKNVAATVRRTEGWTANAMADAFARAGARYAGQPPGEFLRAIDLGRFTSTLGRAVSTEAEFIASLPDAPGAETVEFVPTWLVRLETMTAPGIRWCYDLTFEPFSARLIGVVERPCA